jgi:glycosyltransferase involved in cell wall biosynthesis
VGAKHTGLVNYALHLIPYLQIEGTVALSQTAALSVSDRTALEQSNFTIFDRLPLNMSADQGSRGHFRRLWWTQFQLPQLRANLRSRLLFSPISEAPLFSNCRYVVTAHDLIPLRFPKRTSPLTFYARYYVPQVLNQAQHILCNSVATAEDLMRFFGISASRITPIPLAHHAEHFQFHDLPTRNYFLYIGRNDPHKNLNRLLAAFAALPSNQDFELWLAGAADDSRSTEVLLQQATELGVGDRLKVLDYVPYADLPILFNQAIALVFPSLWEGFGLPVLEAMACGTPVITSNLSSLPEVAGDAAILVDPYNPVEITAAMQVCLDETCRSQLRSAGLARASQFSWAKTGAATTEVLRRYL